VKIIRPIEITDQMIDRNTSFQEDIAEWESAGVAVEPSIEGVNSPILNMLFYPTPTGDVLAYQYYDGSRYWLKTRDWQTGQIRVAREARNLLPGMGLAVRADYRYLAWSYGNRVEIFDAQSSLGIKVGDFTIGYVDDSFFVDNDVNSRVFWRSGESLLISAGPVGLSGLGLIRNMIFITANNVVSGPINYQVHDPGDSRYDIITHILDYNGTNRYIYGINQKLVVYNMNSSIVEAEIDLDILNVNFLVDAKFNEDETAIYFTVRSGGGIARGLYKASGSNYQTVTPIITPAGQPSEPGRIQLSNDGTMLSLARGFSGHILNTATDSLVSGTSRADFGTSNSSAVIPWSPDDERIAVVPAQPNDLGMFNFRTVGSWDLVTADASDYRAGDRVIQGRIVYEALIDEPTTAPSTGADEDPPQWVQVRYANPWRMFDGSSSEGSEGDPVEVQITPGQAVTGVAVIGAKGSTVRVVVEDPDEGIVYDSGDTSFLDGITIDNWFKYFFEPYAYVEDRVFLDIPSYTGATITVTVSNDGEPAVLGELVMGSVLQLGDAQYGTTVGIIDFSRKETDQFGSYSVVERPYSKRAEYDVAIPSGQTGAFQIELAKRRTTPMVWIGDENKSETIVFGFYRDFDIVLDNPGLSFGTITVEGL